MFFSEMPSDIWLAFSTEDCDPKFAKCLFCDKLVSRGSTDPKKQSTSCLTHHIKTKHKEEFEQLLKESKEKKESSQNNGNIYIIISIC